MSVIRVVQTRCHGERFMTQYYRKTSGKQNTESLLAQEFDINKYKWYIYFILIIYNLYDMTEQLNPREVNIQDNVKEIPNVRTRFYFEAMALYGPDMSIYKKNNTYSIGGVQDYLKSTSVAFYLDLDFHSEKDAIDGLRILKWLCILIDRKVDLNQRLWRTNFNEPKQGEIINLLWNGGLKQDIERLSAIYPNLLDKMFEFINKLPRG